MRLVTLNGGFDWAWLQTDLGVAMPPSSQIEEIGAAAALVDENQLRYSLDALCRRYDLTGKNMALLRTGGQGRRVQDQQRNPPQSYIWQLPAEVCGPYGEGDAVNTLLLYETLMPIIEREGTRDAYRFEVDLMPMTIAMRRRGIRIDQDAAEQARDLLLGKRDAALEELSDQHGALIGMDEINSSQMEDRRPSTNTASSLRTTRKASRHSRPANRDGWRATNTGCRG